MTDNEDGYTTPERRWGKAETVFFGGAMLSLLTILLAVHENAWGSMAFFVSTLLQNGSFWLDERRTNLRAWHDED